MSTTRCPQCRAQCAEEWEQEYLRSVGYCRDCTREALPKCRTCGGAYLFPSATNPAQCGLCVGVQELATLGRY